MKPFGIPLLQDHAKTRRLSIALVVLLTDALFFGLTNPLRVSGVVLIVAFVLVGINIYGLLRLAVYLLGIYGFIKRGTGQRLAALVSINVAIALALQSLGELTTRDGVVLVLLSTVAYAYMTYGKNSSRSRS